MSESGLRLYRVDVVITTMVLAYDREEAAHTAVMNYSDSSSYGSEGTSIMEIADARQLPDGWAKSIPFYDGDDELGYAELTCQAVMERLKRQQEEEAEKEAVRVAQERDQLKLFPTE